MPKLKRQIRRGRTSWLPDVPYWMDPIQFLRMEFYTLVDGDRPWAVDEAMVRARGFDTSVSDPHESYPWTAW